MSEGNTGTNRKGAGAKPNEKSHILSPTLTAPQTHTSGGSGTGSRSVNRPQQVTPNSNSNNVKTQQQKNAPKNASNSSSKKVTSTNPSRSNNTRKAGQPGTAGRGGGNQFPEGGNSPVTPVSPASNQNEDDMSQLVHQMDMEEADHKSGMAHTSYNHINSILGSGVIGMPYALHQAGVFMGLALMVLVAVVADYSLVVMIKAGNLAGTTTYQGMMETAFGRPGFYILSIIQFMYPVIAMISYNIIVGDTLTEVLIYFSSASEESPDERRFERESVVLLATLFVTLPLSLYRNVAKLSKVSFLSLVSIGIILLAIIIRLGTMHYPPTPDSWNFVKPSGVIPAIGVFAFAFLSHHNTWILYSSMKNSSEYKWGAVTHISVGVSLIVSLVFGLVGYATFTGMVQWDLLENYCWNDDLINLARTLFCLTILLTFPLECFVARDVIENIFFSGKQPSTPTCHFGITLLIVFMCYVISISTDCLGVVLELNGILAAMPLAYIFPAICFLRLDQSPLWSKEKIPAIATALFGLLVSLTGLIILAANGPSTQYCSHGQQMQYCLSSQKLANSTTSPPAASASRFVQLMKHSTPESLPNPLP